MKSVTRKVSRGVGGALAAGALLAALPQQAHATTFQLKHRSRHSYEWQAEPSDTPTDWDAPVLIRSSSANTVTTTRPAFIPRPPPRAISPGKTSFRGPRA